MVEFFHPLGIESFVGGKMKLIRVVVTALNTISFKGNFLRLSASRNHNQKEEKAHYE